MGSRSRVNTSGATPPGPVRDHRTLAMLALPSLLECFDIDSIAVMARDQNKVTWERPSNRHSLKIMLENVEGDSLGDLHRSGELEAL